MYLKSKSVVILIHETEKIKQRFPDTKKAKIPLLIRLAEIHVLIEQEKSGIYGSDFIFIESITLDHAGNE